MKRVKYELFYGICWRLIEVSHDPLRHAAKCFKVHPAKAKKLLEELERKVIQSERIVGEIDFMNKDFIELLKRYI